MTPNALPARTGPDPSWHIQARPGSGQSRPGPVHPCPARSGPAARTLRKPLQSRLRSRVTHTVSQSVHPRLGLPGHRDGPKRRPDSEPAAAGSKSHIAAAAPPGRRRLRRRGRTRRAGRRLAGLPGCGGAFEYIYCVSVGPQAYLFDPGSCWAMPWPVPRTDIRVVDSDIRFRQSDVHVLLRPGCVTPRPAGPFDRGPGLARSPPVPAGPGASGSSHPSLPLPLPSRNNELTSNQ